MSLNHNPISTANNTFLHINYSLNLVCRRQDDALVDEGGPGDELPLAIAPPLRDGARVRPLAELSLGGVVVRAHDAHRDAARVAPSAG